MFLKLTDLDNDKIMVNIKFIAAVSLWKREDNTAYVHVVEGGRIIVKESPDEVMRLIKKAEEDTNEK